MAKYMKALGERYTVAASATGKQTIKVPTDGILRSIETSADENINCTVKINLKVGGKGRSITPQDGAPLGVYNQRNRPGVAGKVEIAQKDSDVITVDFDNSEVTAQTFNMIFWMEVQEPG